MFGCITFCLFLGCVIAIERHRRVYFLLATSESIRQTIELSLAQVEKKKTDKHLLSQCKSIKYFCTRPKPSGLT
ncbi:hypothetical protein BD560DRAFT_412568 [Blakeslea trispora]|nr:hypothetical protein BD560DRAFT_412568 [Blakeslea trispora]